MAASVSVPRKFSRCAAPPMAADSWRTPPESEVVQLEGKKRRIAGADRALPMTCFDARESVATVMGYQTWTRSVSASGKPIELRVGVFDGDKRVVGFATVPSLTRECAAEAAAVLGIERFEARVIESFGWPESARERCGGPSTSSRVKIWPAKLAFDDVLQHGEHGLFNMPPRDSSRSRCARVRGYCTVGELVGVLLRRGFRRKDCMGSPGFVVVNALEAKDSALDGGTHPRCFAQRVRNC